ncbi:MAG: RNA polymerase sigma factor [Saprospiraceae bacterium]
MTALSMREQQSKELKISGWFSEYGNRLLRFVRSRISDLEEAEDISQEVWYQLSRQDEVDTIGQIGGWLFTVANNMVINFNKKKKSIPFSRLENDDVNAENDENDVEDDLSFDRWVQEDLPSEILESKEFWDMLQKMLMRLPPEQREVFIENELNEVSFREMSEKTGISINTLLARKSYAVKKLRNEFEKILNQ